jgi:hypothetical protein
MNLDTFTPRGTQVTLQYGNGEIVLHFEPWCLYDDAYLEREQLKEDIEYLDQIDSYFGTESGKINFPKLCKLVWHKLSLESKNSIESKVEVRDSKNNAVDLHGYEKIMCLLQSDKQLKKVYVALFECRGYALPDLSAIVAGDYADTDRRGQEVDVAEVYDLIASEYNCTPEEFLKSYNLKQVQNLAEIISRRKRKEVEAYSAGNLPDDFNYSKSSNQPSDITDEKVKKFDELSSRLVGNGQRN